MNFQKSIEDALQLSSSPVSVINGKWSVIERKKLWQELGPKIFDRHLEKIKQCAVTVLSECDPKFDLPPDQRYAANIYEKELKYSTNLRKGLAETLALLGTNPDALTNCSLHKPKDTANLAIREIFKNADWVLWGSLNDILPTLAEAAPNEFLDAVENALDRSPCPFEELLSQEHGGVWGNNYLTGLLWALETLAWDANYLVSVCAILGELAARDPGGHSLNRPANSLATILLPWLPQTTAPIEKREVAIKTLMNEVPDVAWNLLISLLPNQHQMSLGTRKPEWRNTIPDDWKDSVTQEEHWKQVTSYAEMAISMASNDIDKLAQLAGDLNHLPKPHLDKLLEHLSSEEICGKPEDQRLRLWTKLTEFSVIHRRFADTKWALSDKTVSKIEDVAAKLAPKSPFYLHRRLFSYKVRNVYYEGSGTREEQQQKLNQRCQQAINEIMADGGMNMVLQFAESVEIPDIIGHYLGTIAEAKTDKRILPALLETENTKLARFASAYISCRQNINGWEWVDSFDTSNWSAAQIGQFLAYLPFTEGSWSRATKWLGKSEKEYWSKTSARPYHTDADLGFAIDKLIEYDRPHTAIEWLSDKKPLDKSRSVKALMAAISSQEPLPEMGTHTIIEIIEALQDAPDTNPDDLFQIEWAYLSLLDQYASPKSLENRLSFDPDFFCEVVRLIYRSKKKTQSPKKFSKRDKAIAENAYKLLDNWRTLPGTQSNGQFLPEQFTKWLKKIKEACAESGHLDVALIHIGKVLIHAPSDPEGLWIHRTVASALNAKDAKKLRDNFWIGILNSRGVHKIDPTGKPERELAEKYEQKAEEVEKAGYHRFADTLRKLAEGYEREAETYIAEQDAKTKILQDKN